ncbi:MAG: hypothetical protein H6Q31_2190 [Bacteroidetes bacterium]|jgi:uncharacterized protein YdeI (YjbR/CyaY-like superfamily)|nr:hypothetical protein [Bacteroidota bacterium]
MKLGTTLTVFTRKEWRAWLKAHHDTEREIWLVYYKKSSGKSRIPYNDAVEEALCYGWIDSTLKPIDGEKYAQRFSPRRPGSNLSALNKERVRRLIRSRKMTRIGLARIEHTFREHKTEKKEHFTLPPDIRSALKQDPVVWKNYRAFPESYRRIRIGWIDGSRERQQVFDTRLRYFIRMTAKNKTFGMVK